MFLIISGNPKTRGLCHNITQSVTDGAKAGGEEVKLMYTENIERCHVCGEGWGTCRESGKCAYESDGFDEIQNAVREADKICLITPVYWGESAEGLKSTLDRLRRCEFRGGSLTGKQILLIASPGGSGGGMLSALGQLERFALHTKAAIFDYIGINRWNSDYKSAAVYSAARAMAEGRQAGETV